MFAEIKLITCKNLSAYKQRKALLIHTHKENFLKMTNFSTGETFIINTQMEASLKLIMKRQSAYIHVHK